MSDTDKDKRRAERLDIAKHVLAGITASPQWGNYTDKKAAEIALRAADALIAAVDKETPDA